ncbi:MAG: hypothetical protein QNK82_12285 [Akkermansiaceae bacterium]|jgi:hypothetical protein
MVKFQGINCLSGDVEVAFMNWIESASKKGDMTRAVHQRARR